MKDKKDKKKFDKEELKLAEEKKKKQLKGNELVKKDGHGNFRDS